jgi:hypothetical protein
VTNVEAARAESNGGVKVMPLGDSITEGTQIPGGYRIGLWQRFVSAGYRVDYVGSQFNGPSSLGDHDHQGHPGWRIDQIDASVAGWLGTRPRGRCCCTSVPTTSCRTSTCPTRPAGSPR